MALLFAGKVANYAAPQLLKPHHLLADVERLYDEASFKIKASPAFAHCSHAAHPRNVPGGYICAADNASPSVYATIYQRSPIDGGSRDALYSSTDGGSKREAAALLDGVVEIPRSSPWRIPSGGLTWTEDPYKSVYWRLEFYSLRPTQNLLYAYRTTGDARYAKALLALDDSFFAHEATSPYAWSDFHAVAFRAMILTDTWWRLRQAHQLDQEQSYRFLSEIQKTGAFLVDANHYQPENNHAFNEGAALLQLAVDFPALPGATGWRAVAQTRLDFAINSLVDQDGVLVENSPYYQFYALDKLWQINRWAAAEHVTIATDFRSRLGQMINYATYILQPDGSVPLLGASLETYVHNHGTFAEMAKAYPSFKYVLTSGARGRKPPRVSVFYPDTGQAVMRSGWGKGAAFTNQSYLTFNVGPYRTAHSNLDALAVTLYGNGKTLLPGAGLYSYEPGAMRDYFHGTASHDTVLVDGQDQQAGSPVAGRFHQGGGVTYQTGEAALYPGVEHRRMVMMVDAEHYLVTDRLTSNETHTYSQHWLLSPGTTVSTSGLTVTGSGANPSQSLTVTQLDTAGLTVHIVSGQTNPPTGLCSIAYGKAVPCPLVSYSERGTNVEFTTLLTIGRPSPAFTVAHHSPDDITVHDGRRILSIKLTASTASPEVAYGTDTEVSPTPGISTIGSLQPTAWHVDGGPDATGLPGNGGPGFRLTTSGSSTETATQDGSGYDGGANNLEMSIRVSSVESLSHLDVELSNSDWQTFVYNDLRNVYTSYEDREWLPMTIGRGGELTGKVGHWEQSGPGVFDWNKIDGVRLVVEGKSGSAAPVTVDVNQLDAVPVQNKGKVAIVFDDGYESILSAASYLHSQNMAANVAVIGKYAKLPTQDHLNVDQLRMLQNQWGWNMVNHTFQHADGVEVYADNRNLAAYRQDVLAGAQFLEDAGLNSAPNWFVYPHGDTDDALQLVLSDLYKFARTTQDEPTAYPFGAPLAVPDLEVESPADAEGGAQGAYTSPAQIAQAVADTERYGNTLILTFHRIHANPSDPPGYPLHDFETIVNELKASGVEVLTLSQLDRSNGVAEDNHIQIHAAAPSQTVVKVTSSMPGADHSIWTRLTGWL